MFWAVWITRCSFLSLAVHLNMPVCDVSSQDAFFCFSVKVDEILAFLSFFRMQYIFCAFLTRVVMLIPSNLKLLTCSTSAPPMERGMCVFASFFLKSSISLLVLLTLSSWFFSVHHSARLLISSPYECSSFIINMANDGGDVVCILQYRVLSVSGSAVMGVQCEQQGAEHKDLGGSDELKKRRCGCQSLLAQHVLV